MAERLSSRKGDKVSVSPEGSQHASVTSADVGTRFEVQTLLGEGGMGSVFVAQDRGLRRIVALKRLKEGLQNDAGALRRFVLEAQIGAQLEHPNIVPLYSFERSPEGTPAIAMQLLEGMNMADYIEAAGRAPPEARAMRGQYALKERLGTLIGVGEAIHFAHERGVIHRDLKPENVMLGRYHEVYVMDWGLARVIGSPIDMAHERNGSSGDERPALEPAPTDSETLGTLPTAVPLEGPNAPVDSSTATRQGDVMGTAQYMPPEQALGLIDQIGPAADQYALGVILQELTTLRPARSHTSQMEALAQALQNHLEKPVGIDGETPHPALLAIIARATQKQPEARYPSVQAMTEDVRRFVRDEPVSVYPEGIARTLVRTAARRPALAFAILSLCGFTTSVAAVTAVIYDARKTERQAREIENIKRVIVAVSGRAHHVDAALSDLASDVQAVGAATVELLDRNIRDFDRKPRKMPALKPHDEYGGAPVSFEESVVIWPGMKPDERLPPNAAKLARVESWMRTCLMDALPSADKAKTEIEQIKALEAGRSTLLRSFVGLEDGTFTQYPAREVTADPRTRPWYEMAARDPSLHWTRPVADATKRTVRVSAVLGLRWQGRFIGVAGCDLRVRSLAKALKLDVPGFREAYLATEDGKVAVSEKLEAQVLPQVKNPDDDLQLPAVSNPELAQRIKKSEGGGYVVDGDRLIVFSRLVSTPWTYVAELEKARYLEH